MMMTSSLSSSLVGDVVAYRPRSIESASTRQERETASTAGYSEGLAIARAEVAAEFAEQQRKLELIFTERLSALENRYFEALRTVESAAAALDTDLASKLSDAHTKVFEAAMEIAVAVIGAEMTEVSSRARVAVGRVLAVADFSQITEIRMHPKDVAAVQEMADLPQVNLVADESLRPGDAFATMQDGWLDARISETIARVRAALADEYADPEVTP
jgi:flagellar assembly protein FliH